MNAINSRSFQDRQIEALRRPPLDPIPPRVVNAINRVNEDFLHLDSRMRDRIDYPSASDFAVPLERDLEYITEIQVETVELPNAAQVINDANNKIYWRNEERYTGTFLLERVADKRYEVSDPPTRRTGQVYLQTYGMTYFDGMHVYIDETAPFINVVGDFGYVEYNVTLRNGNYNILTICTEIQTQMNAIRRQDTTYHSFIVDPSVATNKITFRSFSTSALVNNPLSTEIDSSIVRVNISNHGLNVGDTFALFNTVPVANFLDTILNTFHVVVDSENTFLTFDIGLPATATTGGGGANVQIGRLVPFKLLFAENMDLNRSFRPNGVYPIIGLPGENTGVAIDSSQLEPVTYTISTINTNVITVNEPVDYFRPFFESVVSGSGPVYTTNSAMTIGRGRVRFFSERRKPFDAFILGSNTFYTDYQLIPGEKIYHCDAIRIRHVHSFPIYKDAHYFFVKSFTGTTITVDEPFFEYFLVDGQHITTNLLKCTFSDPHGLLMISQIQAFSPQLLSITTQTDHLLNGNIVFNVSSTLTASNEVTLVINNHGLVTQDRITIEDNTNANFRKDFFVTVEDSNIIKVNFGEAVGGTSTVSFGDKARISFTQTDPVIHGEFAVFSDTFDPKVFYILHPPLSQYGPVGDAGIVGFDPTVRISRIQGAVEHFSSFQRIENEPFYATPISNTVLMVDMFPYDTDNSDVRLNYTAYISTEYSIRDQITNTIDYEANSVLFQRPTLEGENYVFIEEPDIGIKNQNGVIVLAKIPLNGDPGDIVFYENRQTIRFDPPLRRLNNVHFRLKTFNNAIFDILRLDYSISLRVKSLQATHEKAQRHLLLN